MIERPDISICIPAYSMDGKGVAYLQASFERLVTQTFKNFDIVVSDQSGDGEVADLCTAWQGRLNIVRVDSRHVTRQASANCNVALKNATGRILKVLFQDDYLVSDDACALIHAAFENDATHWALCGSGVSHDGVHLVNPMVPRLHPFIHYGKNTVSSPSVLAFRADHKMLFDEQFIWLMDVDLYRRAAVELGDPAIIHDILVANLLHDGQVSAGVTRALQRHELRLIRRKHKSTDDAGAFSVFAKAYLKAFTPKSGAR